MVVVLKITTCDGFKRAIFVNNEELEMLCIISGVLKKEVLKNWKGGIIPVFDDRGYSALTKALASEELNDEETLFIREMLNYVSYDFSTIVVPGERISFNIAKELIDHGYVVVDKELEKYYFTVPFKNDSGVKIGVVSYVKFDEESGFRPNKPVPCKNLDENGCYYFTGLTVENFEKGLFKKQLNKEEACLDN